MKFYITMCGRARKISRAGEEYGWSAAVFCLTEDFFSEDVLEKVPQITEEAAYDKIYQRILTLNPDAVPKKVKKFILG